MRINVVHHKTWLRRVAIGIAAVILFIPFTILSALYELGELLEDAYRNR